MKIKEIFKVSISLEIFCFYEQREKKETGNIKPILNYQKDIVTK